MLNSRASTFKVSCEHEVKVYECKLVEKRSMKMINKRVVSFTLRPRQAPCSKELCSFRTPKTIYEQFLNSQLNLLWGCPVNKCPNQTPINSSSTNAELSIFSLFFFPPPSSSSPFFALPFSNHRRQVEQTWPCSSPPPPLHTLLELPSEGKMADGRRSVRRRGGHNGRRWSESGWMESESEKGR